MSSKKILAINEVDMKKMELTAIDFKPKKTEYSKTQYISFPGYKSGSKDPSILTFKTDEIKMVQGGIPGFNADYNIINDGNREYFKIPLDETQESTVELFKFCEQIDEWMQSKEVQKKLFAGVLEKKIPSYMPLIKEPNNDNVEEGKEKMKKIKVKLDMDFKSEDKTSKQLLTSVFVRENGTPTPVKLKNITELADIFKWQCKARFIIDINKIWVAKTGGKKKEDVLKHEYGICFKCRQLEIIEKANSSGSKDQHKAYGFGDNIQVETKVETKVEKKPVKQLKKPVVVEVEEEEADEEEVEEEEVEEEEVEEEEEE